MAHAFLDVIACCESRVRYIRVFGLFVRARMSGCGVLQPSKHLPRGELGKNGRKPKPKRPASQTALEGEEMREANSSDSDDQKKPLSQHRCDAEESSDSEDEGVTQRKRQKQNDARAKLRLLEESDDEVETSVVREVRDTLTELINKVCDASSVLGDSSAEERRREAEEELERRREAKEDLERMDADDNVERDSMGRIVVCDGLSRMQSRVCDVTASPGYKEDMWLDSDSEKKEEMEDVCDAMVVDKRQQIYGKHEKLSVKSIDDAIHSRFGFTWGTLNRVTVKKLNELLEAAGLVPIERGTKKDNATILWKAWGEAVARTDSTTNVSSTETCVELETGAGAELRAVSGAQSAKRNPMLQGPSREETRMEQINLDYAVCLSEVEPPVFLASILAQTHDKVVAHDNLQLSRSRIAIVKQHALLHAMVNEYVNKCNAVPKNNKRKEPNSEVDDPPKLTEKKRKEEYNAMHREIQEKRMHSGEQQAIGLIGGMMKMLGGA